MINSLFDAKKQQQKCFQGMTQQGVSIGKKCFFSFKKSFLFWMKI
jgi:hypothetical protein